MVLNYKLYATVNWLPEDQPIAIITKLKIRTRWYISFINDQWIITEHKFDLQNEMYY